MESSVKSGSRFFYGWVILAAVFVFMAVGYALRNTFSVFYPTIVEDFGWGRGSTALMFSISILVYGGVAPLAGSLVDRFDPRLIFSLGALAAGAGVALCGLASSPWQFYLLFGVLGAAGQSLIATTPLSTIISNWFHRRRGLAFGILTSGFGISLVVAPVAQFLISRFGWQEAYIIMGLFSIALLVPLCIFVIRRSPYEKGLLPYGMVSAPPAPPEPDTSRRSLATSERNPSGTVWTLGRALRSYRFWLLFVIAFFILGVNESVAIAHQVYFFRDAGYEPMQTATIYSVFGIMYLVGNPFAYYSDRLGREKVFIAACLVSLIGVVLLFFIKDTSQPWMPYTVAVTLGLGMGASIPVLFATIADLFHGRHFGSIMGSIVLGFALGGSSAPWLAGFLHDRTGSYSVAFAMLLGGFLISALLMLAVAPGRVRPIVR